jgi:hypothetical protein
MVRPSQSQAPSNRLSHVSAWISTIGKSTREFDRRLRARVLLTRVQFGRHYVVTSDPSLGCGGAAGLASDRGSVNVFEINAFVRRDAQWQGQTDFESSGEYSCLRCCSVADSGRCDHQSSRSFLKATPCVCKKTTSINPSTIVRANMVYQPTASYV